MMTNYKETEMSQFVREIYSGEGKKRFDKLRKKQMKYSKEEEFSLSNLISTVFK